MSGDPGQPLAATDHPMGSRDVLDAERAARFDRAHDRLKFTTEEQQVIGTPEPVKRTKDPSYVVFAQDAAEGMWMLLTPTPIKAAGRKAAIVAAAPGEDGVFFAIPAKEFQPLPRTCRQTTVDIFE